MEQFHFTGISELQHHPILNRMVLVLHFGFIIPVYLVQ